MAGKRTVYRGISLQGASRGFAWGLDEAIVRKFSRAMKNGDQQTAAKIVLDLCEKSGEFVEGGGFGVWWSMDLKTARGYAGMHTKTSLACVVYAEVDDDDIAQGEGESLGYPSESPVVLKVGAKVDIVAVEVRYNPNLNQMADGEFVKIPVHRVVTAVRHAAVTLYHGTRATSVDGIRANGLVPPPGTGPGWYMLTDDLEQAKRYAFDGTVIEFDIPESKIFGPDRDSDFFLWPATPHSAYIDHDANAYAVKTSVPGKYIKRVITSSQRTASAPSPDQMAKLREITNRYAPVVAACYDASNDVAAELGLKQVGGYYDTGNGFWGREGHFWNVLLDGTIVDVTHGQFDRSVPLMIAAPGSPEAERYVEGGLEGSLANKIHPVAKTAMPSWRGLHDGPVWADHVAVILVDRGGGRRQTYELYVQGEIIGRAQRLDEAKERIEARLGPLNWRRLPQPEQKATHYFFGVTDEFTDPGAIYVGEPV